jgi:hypothetical protein
MPDIIAFALTSASAFFLYLRAMKFILGLLIISSFFAACSNELVVVDKWKDIPIVWGLVSKSDTAHYIRVEKAFLDPTTSAYDIARIPDSLYYDNAIVTLKRINTGQIFTLERVDGTLEGYPRDTYSASQPDSAGIFAETPNYLYKIKANVINLVIGEKYEFGLQRNDQSAQVTAMTIILPKPVLRNPVAGSKLGIRPKFEFSFDWNDIPDAGIFDLMLRFHYLESDSTGHPFTPKSFDWVIDRNILTSEKKVNGTDFYQAIKANIKEDIQASRRFSSIDIIIWCGGKELAEFIKIAEANNGLTSTQDIPTYTNLSEGLGIFTSRNVSYYTDFLLADPSLDSLQHGSITGNLKFK